MATYSTFYGFENLRSRVYSYHSNYKKFQEIDEAKYEELKKTIHEFIKRLGADYGTLNSLNRYADMLGYISHKVEYNHLPYDERIIMLLEACDPDFIHLKEFLGTVRTENFSADITSAIRKKLGFYDPKFITYENDLFIKFFKNKSLLHGVREDCSFLIYPLMDALPGFDTTTDEEYERASAIAASWRENMTEDDNYLTAFYHVINQNAVLGLKGVREKGIFLVEAIDPTLQMLETFYDSPTYEKLYEDATNKVGFYSEDFMKLEKKYAKRYKPELAEDPWDNTSNIKNTRQNV